MRLGVILVAVAVVVAACGGAVMVATEANAQPPSDQRLPAPDKADANKLKTGEWLDDSTYGWVNPLGGEREALLTVEFRSQAEPGLREQSLQELVTQRLLTAAVRDGYRKARLWVKRSKNSFGPLSLSSNEEWMFELGDGRQWRQTGGPKIDWSMVVQNLAPDPAVSLEVAQKFIQKRWESGVYRLEMHTVAFPGLSPKEAMKSAAELLANITACDLGPSRQPAYLSDERLDAITVFAYPAQKQDLLDIVPFVHFDLGRIEGRWTCDRQSMLDDIEKLDWREIRTWDEVIR